MVSLGGFMRTLLIFLSIGVSLGILVGFICFGFGYGFTAETFGLWIDNPIGNLIVAWAVLGGVIGAYAGRLRQR
jgi:hypothetical protein